MMRQVMAPQAGFPAVAWTGEVQPVMDSFISGEAAEQTQIKDAHRAETQTQDQSRRGCRRRRPGTQGEDRVRVAMVCGVERGSKSMQTMAQPSVNRIFQERPAEQPGGKNRDLREHHN